MLEFPEAFPADAATEIIRILRGKTAETEKHALAKAIWNVAGFAARVAFPPPTYIGKPAIDEPVVIDLCAALEFDAFEFVPDAAGLVPSGLLTPEFWAKLLAILIERLLKGE